MANQSPLSEEERAELVAYLDGELPKPAARTVEAKLNTDPRLRSEMDTLRRTWEMLDYLPKPAPSTNFTSRTLDRVSAIRPISRTSGASHAITTPGVRRKWVLGTSWAAAVVMATLVGYGGGHWLASRSRQPTSANAVDVQPQLVKDFRVIENRRLYERVDDMDFLRALMDPELFGEEN
jgi:anti-sigma factor RsiW